MNCTNAISSLKDAVLLKIYVLPHSQNTLFPAGYNSWRNCIEMKVKAEAKENKANNEIIKIISKFFNISSQDVTIVVGNKGREKTIAMKHVKKHDICRKIEESLYGL
jgi:uncharacterized protein (TIGR00251 family)